MYIVAIAWLYVVLMMAVAEALHADGTVLGAVFTFLLYGVVPLGIVLYLLGTPARRRARLAAEAAEASGSLDPDGRGHAAAVAEGGSVAPERKEP
jgi:hypothetical protein